MADDDKDDRTEPASERRKQEARDNGQVARSQDLTAALLLLVGLGAVYVMSQRIVGHLAATMQAMLGNQYWADQGELIDNAARIAAKPLVMVLVPIFLTMFAASLLVSMFQVGVHFSTKPITPNLGKINPLSGIKRLFAGRMGMQLAMNMLKLVAVGSIAYQQFCAKVPQIVALAGVDFPQNMAMGAGIIYGVALRIVVALVILAILDWLYQRWKLERDLRMTKQQVKDEAKMMEGDQDIKGRRRQLARKMVLQRIQSDVPRADVVVTNPTHLAIAIKYDPETMKAPRVVSKGADFLAMRIRQVAVQHGVPILERKPLAQALYKSVEVGQEVPPEFYQAIAEILAYVYEINGKTPARRAG